MTNDIAACRDPHACVRRHGIDAADGDAVLARRVLPRRRVRQREELEVRADTKVRYGLRDVAVVRDRRKLVDDKTDKRRVRALELAGVLGIVHRDADDAGLLADRLGGVVGVVVHDGVAGLRHLSGDDKPEFVPLHRGVVPEHGLPRPGLQRHLVGGAETDRRVERIGHPVEHHQESIVVRLS